MEVRAYWVDLHVDPRSGAFHGELTIELERFSGPFELDALDLDVESVHVAGAPVPSHLDASRGRLSVDASGAGSGDCRIRFRGTAKPGALYGPYLSRFGSETLWTTMLWPSGCRRLFPCLDGPTKKAVFHVTVTAPERFRVISNAPVERVEPVAGGRRWRFAPTPRMSTYLLYIGVGPFEEVQGNGGAVRVIVATAPGLTARAQYALRHAPEIVAGFAEYYQVPYPLSKLHLVAVPDFWAGGMENWGAIAFAEHLLLVDRATTTSLRRAVAETLAHEIAHQWFGNLVTTAWWDDFWLNESFATFVAFQMVDRLGIEPNVWHDMFLRWGDLAYFEDSLASTHPIQVAVRGPEDVTQLEPGVTYGKGAAVLRMIERFIGEASFRAGLRAYLERFRYGNARGQDLWAALEEAAQQPVQRIMAAWVQRPGLPIVRVRRVGDAVEFEQDRFHFEAEASTDPPWPIPLHFVIDGVDQRTVFDTRVLRVPVHAGSRVRVNPDRVGFYRVLAESSLDPEEREVDRPPVDRWARINDDGAFVLAGLRTIREFLDLVDRCDGATDYLTVCEIADWLIRFRRVLPESDELRTRSLAFVVKQLGRLGSTPRPGEPAEDGVVRELLLGERVLLDLPYAQTLAKEYPRADGLDPSLRAAVVIAMGRVGGPGGVDQLTERLLSVNSEELMEETAVALGTLPTDTEVGRALSLVLDARVRLSVGRILLRAAARNPSTRATVWAWFEDHIAEVGHRGDGTPIPGMIIEESVPYLGLGRVEEVRRFFARDGSGGTGPYVDRAIATLSVFDRLRTRGLTG